MCAVYLSSVELSIYHAGIIGTVYLSSVELSIYLHVFQSDISPWFHRVLWC
jgi:hypothetical protein